MTNQSDPLGTVVVVYPQFHDAVARFEECFESAKWGLTPICCACVGSSGSGKSRLAKYFANRHQRIDHGGWVEIPVLYTEVPSGTTIKRFADQMLYDLGDPLYGRGTTIEKTVRIRELFKRCHLQMLLVDEVNHFVDTERSRVAHDVADWLKTLIDQCNISVAILGIPRCLEVLRQNEQLRRRFSAPLTIGHFRWDLPHDRRFFKQFLRSVQEHLSDYEVPCLSDDDLAFKLHYGSFGLVGYVIKILSSAARHARKTDSYRITEKLLSDAYLREIWSANPHAVNPFTTGFDPDRAPPRLPPSEESCCQGPQRRSRSKQLIPDLA
jgi:hypothetical protein